MYCVNEQELGIVCVSPDCNCEDFDDDGLEVYQGTDWDEWDPEGDWDDEYDDEYWGY